MTSIKPGNEVWWMKWSAVTTVTPVRSCSFVSSPTEGSATLLCWCQKQLASKGCSHPQDYSQESEQRRQDLNWARGWGKLISRTIKFTLTGNTNPLWLTFRGSHTTQWSLGLENHFLWQKLAICSHNRIYSPFPQVKWKTSRSPSPSRYTQSESTQLSPQRK